MISATTSHQAPGRNMAGKLPRIPLPKLGARSFRSAVGVLLASVMAAMVTLAMTSSSVASAQTTPGASASSVPSSSVQRQTPTQVGANFSSTPISNVSTTTPPVFESTGGSRSTPNTVKGGGGSTVSVSVTTSCGIMTFYANNLGSQKLEFAEEGVTGSRYVSKVQIAVIITGHPTGDYYTYDQALTASSTSHNI